MRGRKAIFSASMLWISSFAHSFDFNSSYYGVYEAGVVSGTGNCNYVYIVPKSSFLIVGVDQPTPIMFMPQTTGFRGLSCPDGSLSGFVKVNLTATDMAINGATLSSRYKLFSGDFDGDTKSDFFLQGSGAVLNSVVLTADVSGTPQVYANFYGALNSATYTQINVVDVDQNGRADIVATDTSGNVITQMFNSSGGSYSAPGMSQMLVGSINGKFRVDESGNSNYSVDVLTAAGTAGVVPHISLNYSSSAGDGVMGEGWSIGGLSAITRCRQTLAQDNNTTAITLGASDRFCLDGQRLILTAGTYGAAGSTYRTEIDTYAVVTANGGSIGNPAYFTVVRKDGSTSYYGNGNGSQLVLNGNGPIFTWAISRFQDSVGNPIRFSYLTDSATNEQLINRIDYGYGTNTAATSNSTTYLQFNYEARPNFSSGYIAGSKIQRTKRLKSIYSYNSGNEIRRYAPVYRMTDPVHYQSYVQQLFECVGSSCLSPTTFNWNLNNGGFQSTGSTVATISSSAQLSLRTIDINGDGSSDLVYMLNQSPYTLYYQLWNGAGYSTAVSFGVASQYFALNVLDKNNDGYQDLLVGGGANWHLYLGSSGGLTDGGDTGIPYTISVMGRGASGVSDINSDGLADYVEANSWPTLTYRFSQRINSNGQWINSFAAPQSASINAGAPGCAGSASFDFNQTPDFNGDGNVDIPLTLLMFPLPMGGGSGCAAMSMLVGDGRGTFNAGPWSGTAESYGARELYVDLNGDGLIDRVWGPTALNTSLPWKVAFNIGGVTGGVSVLDSGSTLPGLQFIDYNADMFPDAVYKSASGNELIVRLYNPATQFYGTAFTSSLSPNCTNFVDVNGDGNLDVLCIQNTGNSNVIMLFKSADTGSVGNKVVSIDNGFGNTTTITYKPLTDPAVYTKSSDANDATKWPDAKPVFDIIAPSQVVASVSSTAPRADDTTPKTVNYNAASSVSYKYAGLKAQASGRGLLGFALITTTDNQTGVKTATTYNQTFPFIGQPLTTTLTSSTGRVFKTSKNTQAKIERAGLNGTKYYQVYTPIVTEQAGDPVGNWETSYVVTNTAQPDEWGNVLGSQASPSTVSTIYASDHTTIIKRTSTFNEYDTTDTDAAEPFDYGKRFARLRKAETTQSQPGQDNITRISLFSYYGKGSVLRGLLKTEQVSTPDGSASALKTYQYDQFGNKRCATVGSDVNATTNCSAGTANRYEVVNYDTAGRYVVDKRSQFKTGTNWVEAITEQVVTRNAMGLPTQVNSLNGVVTNFAYDALGRESSRSDNTGAAATTTYTRYGITGAQYNVTTTTNTGAVGTQYFDALGRGIAKWQRSYDGRWSVSETEYDSIGRVKRQSSPHYDNETIYWSTNTYDAFRLQGQSTPVTGNILASSSMAYSTSDGYAVMEVTNALGQKRKEFTNAVGEVVKVIDNLANGNLPSDSTSNAIAYTYDAAGQLIQTSITGKQNGSAITLNTYLEYDQLGRKIKMRDSSKGTWFYKYNAFGDLASQYKVTSANNYTGTLDQALTDTSAVLQYTAMNYDRRGRMVYRQDVNHSMYGAYVNDEWQWIYDTATNGVGQLAQEQQTIGGSFNRTYAYDTKGRPSSTMHSDGNGSYVLTVEYDSFGRPYKNTDALGTGSGTINNYNSYGYVQSVIDLAGNTTLYSVQSMDARGGVTSAIYGNGATTNWSYDQGSGLLTNQTTTSALGVMLQRLDYTWDVLGRQTSRWDRGIQTGTTYKNLQQSFCYDSLNRLTKSHQGTLSGSCSLTPVQQDQQYDDFGNITSKGNVGTYTYNSVSAHQLQSTSDGVSYTYDKVGNLISDTSGRTLSYTAFDKVASVSKGSNQITYAYGPDRNYYKRTDTVSGSTTNTYYIGNVEKVVKADGSYDMKRYLAGVALFNHHFNSSGTQTSVDKQFMYKDALGSMALITDNVGVVKQQSAYNSWGERVNTTDWQTVLPSATFLPVSQQFTTKSYTGQEAMDAVGLVNYGGRVYDPRIARFIQADPIVQNSVDLQAYNRYAYVRNNPLTLIDPSGYRFGLKGDFNPFNDYKEIKKPRDVWEVLDPVAAYAASQTSDKWLKNSETVRSIGSIAMAVVDYYWCGGTGACVAGYNAYVTELMGGSLKDTASAFAFSYVSAQGSAFIGGNVSNPYLNVLSHAAFGGVMADLQGGNFGSGFAAAGIGAAAGYGMKGWTGKAPIDVIGRTLVAAAVGGTASQMTGGKFANGAISAAFVHVFNSELHRSLPSADKLLENYPAANEDGTPAHPSADGYGNQCAIRLSVALEGAGFSLDSYPKINQTSEGYARSSKGLADYLWREVGAPLIVSPETFHKEYYHTFKGVIYLAPPPGGVGHIDVWNAGRYGSGYYSSSEVWLFKSQ